MHQLERGMIRKKDPRTKNRPLRLPVIILLETPVSEHQTLPGTIVHLDQPQATHPKVEAETHGMLLLPRDLWILKIRRKLRLLRQPGTEDRMYPHLLPANSHGRCLWQITLIWLVSRQEPRWIRIIIPLQTHRFLSLLTFRKASPHQQTRGQIEPKKKKTSTCQRKPRKRK